MLSRLDDYPIHQVPLPVAHPGTSDRNHYDRYFFNGYLPGGEVYFGAAMGLYPNRRVIDAAFSVINDGVQRNVYASGLAPVERTQTRVGPLRVEVVEPMERIRVIVDDNDYGVGADVTFDARAVAIEEDRQTRSAGNLLVMDVTRFTQSGTWSGWVESGGTRIDLDPAVARGTRDRSWGVRPVGEPPGGAPASSASPQIFWLWAPLHFRDRCTYIALFGDADGNFWYQHALIAPVRTGADDPTVDPGGVAELLRSVEVEIEWEKGTRRSRAASMVLHGFRGSDRTLTFEPIYTFQMCGIGYSHPTWAHGTWHGEAAVGGDSWRLDDVDPMAPNNLHIQQLCRVTLDGEPGCGILEQIAIGPHHPSGLTGTLDPYSG